MIFSTSLYRQKLNRLLQSTKLKPGLTLDLGAQSSTYYHHYFSPTTIISIDITGKPAVLASAYALPFLTDSFTAVLALNVFEHLHDPNTVLSQLAKTLKPGGQLIIATPFFKNIHSHPYDYYRFTDQAWIHLLEKHGFEAISVTQIGDGPLEAVYDMLLQFTPHLLRPLLFLALIPLNRLITAYSPNLKKVYPLGYFVTAQKPQPKH